MEAELVVDFLEKVGVGRGSVEEEVLEVFMVLLAVVVIVVILLERLGELVGEVVLDLDQVLEEGFSIRVTHSCKDCMGSLAGENNRYDISEFSSGTYFD